VQAVVGGHEESVGDDEALPCAEYRRKALCQSPT
jgi:hypothetical protein